MRAETANEPLQSINFALSGDPYSYNDTLRLMQRFFFRNWSATSSKWVFVEQGSKLLFYFAQSVVLARMLTPTDFGIFASLALIVGLSSAFSDPGVSTHIVQLKRLTPVTTSAAFLVVLLSAGSVSLLMLGAAPAIGSIFKLPELQPAVVLLAASTMLVALAAVPTGLLMRNLQFRLLAIGGIASSVAGLVCGVVSAAAGWGLVSLFLIPLGAATISNLAFWPSVGRLRWQRPNQRSVLWTLNKCKPLVSVRAADAVLGGVTNGAIAGTAGLHDLAMLGRSESLRQIPISLASAVIGRLYLPQFAAALRSDGEIALAASDSLLAACRRTMLFTLPIFAYLYVFSKELTLLIYGAQWVDAASILSLLVPGGVFILLQSLAVNFLLGIGASTSYVRLDMAKKLLFLAAIMVLAFGSIRDYAVVTSVCWLVTTIAYFVTLRRKGFRFHNSWRMSVLKYVVASLSIVFLLSVIKELALVLGLLPGLWLGPFAGASCAVVVAPVVYWCCGIFRK